MRDEELLALLRFALPVKQAPYSEEDLRFYLASAGWGEQESLHAISLLPVLNERKGEKQESAFVPVPLVSTPTSEENVSRKGLFGLVTLAALALLVLLFLLW